MRIKALRTFNIFYEGKYYNAYEGEIKYWDTDIISYILNNFDDYIKILDQRYNEFRGTSSDEKPQYAPKYSLYLELDTGDIYYLKQQKGITNNILLEEETIICNEYESSTQSWFSELNSITEIENDTIFVVFDGHVYECHKNYFYGTDDYYFGACHSDPDSGELIPTDFSEYPFSIFYGGVVYIETQDNSEHTIEIYTQEDADALWLKVGYKKSDNDDDETEWRSFVVFNNTQYGDSISIPCYRDLTESPLDTRLAPTGDAIRVLGIFDILPDSEGNRATPSPSPVPIYDANYLPVIDGHCYFDFYPHTNCKISSYSTGVDSDNYEILVDGATVVLESDTIYS